ncbi:glycosyltransferase [Salinibacter ruber]|uniref:glycosyltransferase family protein n=1 Tax=Salinibacter ruber TaxID=146919 RepID=UPI002166DF98|nr:glycosyltransferase [Salinibacter ruber]MCS4136391.1 hypothetical protein [Salinibacter ruber]
MRIFLSCLQSDTRHPVPAYGFWETYFKKGLEEGGHEWVEAEEVDWAEGLAYDQGEDELSHWKDRAWSRTVEVIRTIHEEEEIDLFLSYLFPKQVEPSAVRDIQNLGIPCVNFFCDNVRELRSVPESYHCFDLHWVPEFKALAMYEEAGLKHIHAPMPCWIPPEQRSCEHVEKHGPTFIGSRDPLRAALFEDALKKGATITLRGPAWSGSGEGETSHSSLSNLPEKLLNQISLVLEGGISALLNKMSYRFRDSVDESVFEGVAYEGVFGEEYVRTTQQSEITIGVNRYPSFRDPFSNPDTYSRLRDIEAPMMGACYLTEFTEGLGQRYKIGEEIETYRTAEELTRKIEHLRSHPEKRKQMRCAGQKRALSDHTIQASLDSICEHLGID